MSIALRKLCHLRLALTGIGLTMTASLATAAIVMWLPDSPVSTFQDERVARNLSEYVWLHRARNSVVPPYLRVEVETALH